MKPLKSITCPYCGNEYHPQEIYIPSSFFGSPRDIERDSQGKIRDFCGADMDLVETYCCDMCGNEFKVTQRVTFNQQEKKKKFSTVYSTKLKDEKLSLSEE